MMANSWPEGTVVSESVVDTGEPPVPSALTYESVLPKALARWSGQLVVENNTKVTSEKLFPFFSLFLTWSSCLTLPFRHSCPGRSIPPEPAAGSCNSRFGRNRPLSMSCPSCQARWVRVRVPRWVLEPRFSQQSSGRQDLGEGRQPQAFRLSRQVWPLARHSC